MAARLARETPITFWRGMNLNDASIDATKARKAALAGKRSTKDRIAEGTKRRCCLAVTVRNHPCFGIAAKQPN
jgi:hypothetical protein